MAIDKSKTIVLDCTLRDGSYVIDFQFTKEDTSRIASELYKAGFPYIEVGHGVGLGASKRGFDVAAATDEEYCEATAPVVGDKAKWGMFCIPGIAKLEDLEMAIDHGMGFVRVGTDVHKVDESLKFIELAKKKGLEVFANFMKSYVLSPVEFAELVNKSHGFGADGIYLVDSAGGMLPDQVKAFIRAAYAKNPDFVLGFHGHNNLGLGMANALVSIEEGVTFIDTSLQGFGRSAGNVPAEQLVCLLDLMGLNDRYDPIMIMNLGETLIRPLIAQRGMSSLDITAGWSQFHSSFMPMILKIAKEERIDPRLLINEVCKVNKITTSLEHLQSIAKTINASDSVYSNLKTWPTYFGEEELKIS
jgi:4-hydroxy 2-oxovalerate aldolase